MTPGQREDFDKIIAKLEEMQRTVEELDDVVRGDTGRRIPGLMEDMRTVHDFIVKWDRREYMIRGAFLLLSSNIVLSVLAIIAQVFLT